MSGVRVAAVGGICAVVALTQVGAPIGAGLWVVAVIIACNGYGEAASRATRDRVGFAMTTVIGLALVVAASTMLAHAGLLARTAQIGVVALGIGLRAVASLGERSDPTPAAVPRGVLVLALGAGALVIAVELTQFAGVVDDEVNHVLAIKQLWDTGGLPDLHHQLGGQLVGEAVFALGGGPQLAGVFDGGVCGALLVLVLALELGGRADRLGLGILGVLGLSVVVMPEPTTFFGARWSGTLLHVAAFIALRRTISGRPPRWSVGVIASGLAVLRHEYVILALAYGVGAGLSAEPLDTRTRQVVAIVGWLIALVVIQLALGSEPARAVIGAIAVGLAVPLSWCLAPVLVVATRRNAITVLTVAVGSAAIAGALRLLPGAPAAASTGLVIWFGAALALALQVDDEVLRSSLSVVRLRLGVAAVIVTAIVVQVLASPLLDDGRRFALRDRFAGAFDRFNFVREHGYDDGNHARSRALQDRVPVGARLGFWGEDPGALDYARNSIRDLTGAGSRFRSTPVAADLRAIDYLIVEDVAPREVRGPDVWGYTRHAPTAGIETLLEPVAVAGSTRLVRIRR